MSLQSKRNEPKASNSAYWVCGEREMANACGANNSTFVKIKSCERSRRSQNFEDIKNEDIITFYGDNVLFKYLDIKYMLIFLHNVN